MIAMGMTLIANSNVDEIDRDAILDRIGRPADRPGRRLADKAAGAFDDGRFAAARVIEQRRAADAFRLARRIAQP
jgi:hypothetical protein